jgi:hypothetical protein
MNKNFTSFLAVAVLATGVVAASPSFAASCHHPRINHIEERLERQQNRIDAGVKQGTISAKQEARDVKIDERVDTQLENDEAKHDGHMTVKEENKLDKELNKDSKDIYDQRHD